MGQFFDIRNILDQLYEPILKENAASFFDTIVRIDANKIILFKVLSYSNGNLSDEINKSASQVF